MSFRLALIFKRPSLHCKFYCFILDARISSPPPSPDITNYVHGGPWLEMAVLSQWTARSGFLRDSSKRNHFGSVGSGFLEQIAFVLLNLFSSSTIVNTEHRNHWLRAETLNGDWSRLKAVRFCYSRNTNNCSWNHTFPAHRKIECHRHDNLWLIALKSIDWHVWGLRGRGRSRFHEKCIRNICAAPYGLDQMVLITWTDPETTWEWMRTKLPLFLTVSCYFITLC